MKDHCDLGFSSFFPSFLPLQPWYRNPSPPISPFPQFPNPPSPPRHCFCDVCESRGWGPPTANQGQNFHDDEPPPPSQRTNDVICHVLTICHVALSLSLSLSLFLVLELVVFGFDGSGLWYFSYSKKTFTHGGGSNSSLLPSSRPFLLKIM